MSSRDNEEGKVGSICNIKEEEKKTLLGQFSLIALPKVNTIPRVGWMEREAFLGRDHWEVCTNALIKMPATPP